MNLSATDRIAAPRDAVYRHYVDYQHMEALAEGRGAEITRKGGPAFDTLAWDIRAPFRGRVWELSAFIAESVQAERVVVTSRGGSFGGSLTLTFADDEQGGTEVRSALTIGSNSIPAGVLLTSLRLAQGELQRRFESRMKGFAERVQRACTG